MSTDPEIFRELGPTVARLLAELVDSDDPPDSSARVALVGATR